jgi:excisionase family DNA binding protein
MDDELLTVSEAARRLKLHPVTVRNMLRAGTINGMKVGAQQWRFPESSLKAFIASRMSMPLAVGKAE